MMLLASEMADERLDLFEAVDTAAHIYQVRPDAARPHLAVYDIPRSPPLPPSSRSNEFAFRRNRPHTKRNSVKEEPHVAP